MGNDNLEMGKNMIGGSGVFGELFLYFFFFRTLRSFYCFFLFSSSFNARYLHNVSEIILHW